MSFLRTKPKRSLHWEDRHKPQQGPTRLSVTQPPHHPWSLPLLSVPNPAPGTLMSLLFLQWSGLLPPLGLLPSCTLSQEQASLRYHLLSLPSSLVKLTPSQGGLWTTFIKTAIDAEPGPGWSLDFVFPHSLAWSGAVDPPTTLCNFLFTIPVLLFFRPGTLHLLIHYIPYYLFCYSSVSSYCSSCMGQGLSLLSTAVFPVTGKDLA